MRVAARRPGTRNNDRVPVQWSRGYRVEPSGPRRQHSKVVVERHGLCFGEAHVQPALIRGMRCQNGGLSDHDNRLPTEND